MKLKIKIKEGCRDIIGTPEYGHVGDAGFDLRTTETITLKPGERGVFPTGLLMEIPEGYVGLVWDKGGVGQRRICKTLGGVVDSTYRGEVMVALVNLGKEDQAFKAGDKVAQMVIQKYEHVDFEVVNELSDTDRGEGRWGSTGE